MVTPMIMIGKAMSLRPINRNRLFTVSPFRIVDVRLPTECITVLVYPIWEVVL